MSTHLQILFDSWSQRAGHQRPCPGCDPRPPGWGARPAPAPRPPLSPPGWRRSWCSLSRPHWSQRHRSHSHQPPSLSEWDVKVRLGFRFLNKVTNYRRVKYFCPTWKSELTETKWPNWLVLGEFSPESACWRESSVFFVLSPERMSGFSSNSSLTTTPEAVNLLTAKLLLTWTMWNYIVFNKKLFFGPRWMF